MSVALHRNFPSRHRFMVVRTVKLLKWAVVLLALVLAGVLALRAWESQRGPPLQLWHTFVPHDLHASAIDKLDWKGYIAAENKLFDEVRNEVTLKLDEDVRNPGNRYFDGSPIYPGRFTTDWNRSYVLEPSGPPIGTVVMLHGLTDSPYSLRHLARHYQARGYVAVAIRLPGHGTVPSGLTAVHWTDWSAATWLAVREARRLSGPGKPLHLIGFSNGGALAMKYALDEIGDPALPPPTRIVLISPMIGVTEMARFEGIFGWPLGLEYPAQVFSLSHVALPFPLNDSLYGLLPDSTDEDFGVQLGAMSFRGERGTLTMSLDSLIRMASNPFFAYMQKRIDEGINVDGTPAAVAPAPR